VTDYVAPGAQTLPFQNLPSTATKVTAEWLNGAEAALVDVAAAGGRVKTLERGSAADVVAPYPTGVAATDTAALQAAIDATPTAGVLHIPSSTTAYATNAVLTVNKHMTIMGTSVIDTFRGISASGDSSTPSGTFLAGTVIEQGTAATDILKITGSGVAVNLYRLGLRFATGIAGNTGHGVNATTTATYNSAPDLGPMSFTWDDIHVAGHDGNHYAFVITNGLYGTTRNLRGYGGGGIKTVGSHNTINCGNHVHINPYFAVNNSGSAAGFLHVAATSGGNGGVLNLITYIRPQAEFGGAAATAGTQYMWDDLSGVGVPQRIIVIAPDLESTSNPVRFGYSSQLFGHYIIGTAGRSETITAVGSRALSSNPSATDLTAVGYNALAAVTTQGSGTAVGSNALASATTGSTNTAVGAFAGQYVTTGSRNTIIGYNAGTNPNGSSSAKSITGGGNVFIGYQSGNASGDQNSGTAIGHNAVIGDSSTALGNGATASGNGATALGMSATASADGAVAIGRDSSGGSASAASANVVALGTANHLVKITGRLTVAPRTPSSTADSQGAVGDIASDDSYVYAKTSAGWKRAALSTF